MADEVPRVITKGATQGILETRSPVQRLNTATSDLSPLERIASALERLADRLAPVPDEIVGSDYVAAKLGCTPTHVARQAREGNIPRDCIAPGCGDGKPWKFLRASIDKWLEVR